jgi:chromosome segregation ATPase
MEAVKNPQNLAIGALFLGWGGSTVYFFRNITEMRAEIKKCTDAIEKLVSPINNHTQKFNEVKTYLDKNHTAVEQQTEQFSELADILENQEQMHNYLRECLSAVKRALDAKEIKVDFPMPPAVEYQLESRNKKKVKRRKNKKEESDSESDEPPKPPKKNNDRRNRHDSDSDEDVQSQLKRYQKKK